MTTLGLSIQEWTTIAGIALLLSIVLGWGVIIIVALIIATRKR